MLDIAAAARAVSHCLAGAIARSSAIPPCRALVAAAACVPVTLLIGLHMVVSSGRTLLRRRLAVLRTLLNGHLVDVVADRAQCLDDDLAVIGEALSGIIRLHLDFNGKLRSRGDEARRNHAEFDRLELDTK